MSTAIPIESAEDELEYERQQKQVCADNFMQAMILYNKSEDERKDLLHKLSLAELDKEDLNKELLVGGFR